MTEQGATVRRQTRSRNLSVAPQRPSVNAGLGGATGGTGIIGIAQVVGVHTLLGEILLYAAPTVSVVAGTVAYQLQSQANWLNELWEIKRARRTLLKQLISPGVSDETKAKIRQMIDELDHTLAEMQLSRVKVIASRKRK